jgi:prevent-host-death family protein
MEWVSVAVLKRNLRGYLAAVKKGKGLVITSHRPPIARLSPLEKAADGLQIISAKKPVSSLKKIKGVKLDVDLLAELLAARRRR